MHWRWTAGELGVNWGFPELMLLRYSRTSLVACRVPGTFEDGRSREATYVCADFSPEPEFEDVRAQH